MQNDNFDDLRLENQLCFPLYACARKVVGLYTPFFKSLGITYTQYIALLVLWEKDGITVGELGQKLYLDNGTLTPLLKKMENEGYLMRTRSKQDERVVTITLTQKGYELREAAKEIPQKVGSCLGLSPSNAKELYQLLYKVLETI